MINQTITLINERLGNKVTSQSGQKQIGPFSGYDKTTTQTIAFPKTFEKIPTVSATAKVHHQSNGIYYSASCSVSNITKAGFTVTVSNSTLGNLSDYVIVDWVASAPV